MSFRHAIIFGMSFPKKLFNHKNQKWKTNNLEERENSDTVPSQLCARVRFVRQERQEDSFVAINECACPNPHWCLKRSVAGRDQRQALEHIQPRQDLPERTHLAAFRIDCTSGNSDHPKDFRGNISLEKVAAIYSPDVQFDFF